MKQACCILFRRIDSMAQQHHWNSVFYATTYHPIQAGSIDGTDTAPHDNAVHRALLASAAGLYDPTGDQKAVGDPYNTLFVARLAHHTTEKTIHEAMSKFGKVKSLRLVRHIGASRGYAFVEFESDKDMLYAYEMAHQSVIDGSQILVDYNRQQLMPGWIPRRLGGGLGGRKESGQLRFGGRDRPFRAPLRPQDQLVKLGIPLPPVGRYMSRFQLPPVPRRPESLKERSYRRRKSSHAKSQLQDTLPSETQSLDVEVKMNQESNVSRSSSVSSSLRRRSTVTEGGLSTRREHRNKHRMEEGSGRRDDREHRHDNERKHKKRSHTEHENSTRYGHDERERSRRHSSRSGHEDKEASRQHRRERVKRERSADDDESRHT